MMATSCRAPSSAPSASGCSPACSGSHRPQRWPSPRSPRSAWRSRRRWMATSLRSGVAGRRGRVRVRSGTARRRSAVHGAHRSPHRLHRDHALCRRHLLRPATGRDHRVRCAARCRARQTDSFQIIFDTYRDRLNGFVFGTNPAGIEYDGQVTNEGQGGGGLAGGLRQQTGSGSGFNVNWDGAWEVRSRISEIGWSAEFAIPFRTLRFPSGARQTWGVNFQRNIRRRNERSYWAPVSRQYNLYGSRSRARSTALRRRRCATEAHAVCPRRSAGVGCQARQLQSSILMPAPI